MKDSDLARLALADHQTVALAREATRAMSVVDSKAFAAAAEATRDFQKLRLGNVAAMREAAKALESIRPIAASQIAEALKGIDTGATSSIARSFKNDSTAFHFAKTFDEKKYASLVQPRVAEAFKAWQVPPGFSRAVAEALRGATGAAGMRLAPLAGEAVRSAVAVSQTQAAADIAAEAIADLDLDDLSASERIELQAEVISAIGALGTVVAILVHDGRLELASAMVALVAILVSIYSRISDR